MRPWATWCGGWHPCLWQRAGTGWSVRSFPTQAILQMTFVTCCLWGCNTGSQCPLFLCSPRDPGAWAGSACSSGSCLSSALRAVFGSAALCLMCWEAEGACGDMVWEWSSFLPCHVLAPGTCPWTLACVVGRGSLFCTGLEALVIIIRFTKFAIVFAVRFLPAGTPCYTRGRMIPN